MLARHPRRVLALALPALALAMLPLVSCGHQTIPSPTAAALNTPEGVPAHAPACPDDLRPPPAPPQPGHMGRTP
jgi:hypothetical protein